MMGIGLPINIKPRKNCSRCGLKHRRDLSSCPHCAGLSERELVEFKAQHAEQLKANGGLGLQFLAVTLLIAVVLLALAI